MLNKFNIRICSDLDYEELVADVTYESQTIATISQDKGENNMEIEIFLPSEGSTWKFPMNDFINALQTAKKCLTQMQDHHEKK